MRIRKFNENIDGGGITINDLYTHCFLDMMEERGDETIVILSLKPDIECDSDFYIANKTHPNIEIEDITLECPMIYYHDPKNLYISTKEFDNFVSNGYYKIKDMSDYLEYKGYELTFLLLFTDYEIRFTIKKKK